MKITYKVQHYVFYQHMFFLNLTLEHCSLFVCVVSRVLVSSVYLSLAVKKNVFVGNICSISLLSRFQVETSLQLKSLHLRHLNICASTCAALVHPSTTSLFCSPAP